MTSLKTYNNDWRIVASTIYKKPTDSKIFGQVDLDVTDLEEFISKKRKEGLKITLTHVFLAMIARGLKTEVPELNVYVRRGKLIPKPSIDAMVSVLQADGGMGSVKVQNADTLNLTEIEQALKDEIIKSRKGEENKTMQRKSFMASIPWPFRYWFYRIFSTITINWGIPLPFLGVSANSFGTFLLTNIGSIGLDTGYPALFPISNVAFVLVLGGIQKKPVVINNEIVIRRMMSLSAVIDHRVADASHAGRMIRYIKQVMRDPGQLL